MTRIGGRPPGVDAARDFAQAEKRVNPSVETLNDEFHAAQESVKKRAAAESDASTEINKSEQKKSAVPPIDPAVERMLWEQGIKPR